MKKRTKIIIIVSILLIFAIIGIFSLVIYLDRKIGVHTFTIAEISDKLIYAGNVFGGANYSYDFDDIILQDENFNEIDKSSVTSGSYVYLYLKEDTYNFYGNTTYFCKVNSIDNNKINVEMPEWEFYSFFTENARIKDINGNKIDSSNLKVGDTIKVININPKYTPDIAQTYEGSYCSSIYDVKSIKVIETDEETKEKLANRNMLAIKTAIVAGVNDDYLCVVDSQDQNLLYNVYYPEEGNRDFEIGQEIKIYFNGKSTSTSRNGISELRNVGKIEIIDNANHLIPDEILKKFNTNYNNVEVSINNLTNAGLTLTITDKNDIKYKFASKFYLSKNVAEKPDKNSVEYNDGSIAILPYDGDKWQLLYQTPNDSENTTATENSGNTENAIATETSNNTENSIATETIDENSTRWTFDWSKVYGTLESGEYRFVMGDAGNDPNSFLTNGYDKEIVSVKFTIDDNGQVTDYEVNKGY